MSRSVAAWLLPPPLPPLPLASEGGGDHCKDAVARHCAAPCTPPSHSMPAPTNCQEFMRLTNEKLELRKSLLPFLGMFTCDTGGLLSRVVHFYHYDNFDHRDKHRAMTAASKEWQAGGGAGWCAG